MGMYGKMYTVTDKLSSPPHIHINRPMDTGTRRLETYLTTRDPLKARLIVLVVPIIGTRRMIETPQKPAQMRTLTLPKRLNNATHAYPDQLKRICDDEARVSTKGWVTPELTDSINKFTMECLSCAM